MKTEVYIAMALAKKHPMVFHTITDWLADKDVTIRPISADCPNQWCRDYLPVQVRRKRKYVRFVYDRDLNKYAVMQTPKSVFFPFYDCKQSDLRLDGGNVVSNGVGTVIITDTVFKRNRRVRQVTIIQTMEKLLEAKVVIIPTEPGDVLGHSDGIVRFIDGTTVFVNDYEKMHGWKCYGEKLYRTLESAGVSYKLLPFAYDRCPEMTQRQFQKLCPGGDYFNPAVGYYVNYLPIAGKIVLYPTFGFREDMKVGKLLEKAYQVPAIDVPCTTLALEGGLINCVTREYTYE
jgi:agmatine/peptidylarginine deiminase